MRLGAYILAASLFLLPAALTAQEYAGTNLQAPRSVLRPAATVAWRNYVAVPDGPCGCAMSVEADCYNDCPHRCNPVRFLRRVGRMLDCLVPCNLCCPRGGCGLLHGPHPGKCSICCGVACSGDCGGGNLHSNCCPNPCGSAFAPIAPSCGCGGACHTCSSALPGFGDPFIDDPTPPMPPIPTSQPATEVRRAPAPRTLPVQPALRQVPATIAPSPSRSTSDPSVLRRASAEEEIVEPAPLNIDRSRAIPISRSQKYAAPANPLR
jgi:hypothetical protein